MSNTEKIRWTYSFDEENFIYGQFGSETAALAHARKEASHHVGDEGFKWAFLAEATAYKNPRFFPDADVIIEHMECQAEDAGGEYAEHYPDVTDEAKTELTKKLHQLLNEWCDKYEVEPTFFEVGVTNPVELSQGTEDVS